MKNLLITLFIPVGFIINTACNNSKDESRADEKNVISASTVPVSVQSAFTAKYPGATEVIWEDAHEGDSSTYKVKFSRDGKYWKAEFNTNGGLIKEKEDN